MSALFQNIERISFCYDEKMGSNGQWVKHKFGSMAGLKFRSALSPWYLSFTGIAHTYQALCSCDRFFYPLLTPMMIFIISVLCLAQDFWGTPVSPYLNFRGTFANSGGHTKIHLIFSCKIVYSFPEISVHFYLNLSSMSIVLAQERCRLQWGSFLPLP